MKKKQKPKKSKKKTSSKVQESSSQTISDNSIVTPPANRPLFQEAWKSDEEKENSTPLPKKNGILRKMTSLILRLSPNTSAGDLITKGEIKSAREKMETELGDQLTKLRNQKQSEPGQEFVLLDRENQDVKNKKRDKNSSSNRNNPKIQSEENLMNVKELLSQVKDSELDKALQTISPSQYSSILNKISSLNFPSYDQFYSALGTEVCGFLDDLRVSLNYKISVLRKDGGDDDGAELKLMSVPLKIKLFRSSFSKVDFDKIMLILNEVGRKIREQESQLADEKNKSKIMEDEINAEEIPAENKTSEPPTSNNSPSVETPSQSEPPTAKTRKKRTSKPRKSKVKKKK